MATTECTNPTLSVDFTTGQLLQTSEIGAPPIVGAESDGDSGDVMYVVKTPSLSNPRYPHTILIKRTIVTDAATPTSPDPFGGGTPAPTTEVVTLYNGEGRNYTEKAATMVDGVAVRRLAISVPFSGVPTSVTFMKGDDVTVTERNRTLVGRVEDSYLGNLGMTIWWTKVTN